MTKDVDVALFFATTNLSPSSSENPNILKTDTISSESLPVIYLLSPWDRYSMNYEKLNPGILSLTRPERQDAYFVHSGWGFSSNDCARKIFMAIYLDPNGDVSSKYNSKYLFPAPEEDSLFKFLLNSSKLPVDKNLKKYLANLYTVI